MLNALATTRGTRAAVAAILVAILAAMLMSLPPAVFAQSQSNDATLSALTISPKNIIGFAADRTSYQVGVASTVTEATITATPTDANADVSFDSQDSNDVTDGHQVALVAGRNAVTITVTAEDSSTQDYTISVNQSVAGDYGWRAQDDLDGLKAERISTPFGIWTNSTTIWVVSTDGEKAYAYNHDGTRDAAKDFDFDSSHQDARGAWSDGEYVWIADRENNKLYVYEVATGTRQNSQEFDLNTENVEATGVWSDDATIWVADSFVNSIPSVTGSPRSIRTKWGFSASMRRSTSSGLPVTIGVWPAAESVFRTSLSICGSSSTARMRARPLAVCPERRGADQVQLPSRWLPLSHRRDRQDEPRAESRSAALGQYAAAVRLHYPLADRLATRAPKPRPRWNAHFWDGEGQAKVPWWRLPAHPRSGISTSPVPPLRAYPTLGFSLAPLSSILGVDDSRAAGKSSWQGAC